MSVPRSARRSRRARRGRGRRRPRPARCGALRGVGGMERGAGSPGIDRRNNRRRRQEHGRGRPGPSPRDADASLQIGRQVFRTGMTREWVGRQGARRPRPAGAGCPADSGRIGPIRTPGAAQCFGEVVAPKKGPPRQQEVEDAAQAENVAGDADPVGVAAHLLRRHVGDRAGHALRASGFVRPALPPVGQPEVDQPGPAAFVDEDVPGLDVQVQDAAPMHHGQGPPVWATSAAA